MKLTNNYKNIFSGLRHVAIFNPLRDWFILLLLFVSALTVSVGWNMWVFETVSGGGSIGTQKTIETNSALNNYSFDAVQTIVDTRASEELKYKNGGYHFTDPSQ